MWWRRKPPPRSTCKWARLLYRASAPHYKLIFGRRPDKLFRIQFADSELGRWLPYGNRETKNPTPTLNSAFSFSYFFLSLKAPNALATVEVIRKRKAEPAAIINPSSEGTNSLSWESSGALLLIMCSPNGLLRFLYWNLVRKRGSVVDDPSYFFCLLNFGYICILGAGCISPEKGDSLGKEQVKWFEA